MPKIAQKQKESVRETIADCFNNYHQEVTKRIDEDIKVRKIELDNLLESKDIEGKKNNLEIQKLNELNKQVSKIYQDIKSLITI